MKPFVITLLLLLGHVLLAESKCEVGCKKTRTRRCCCGCCCCDCVYTISTLPPPTTTTTVAPVTGPANPIPPIRNNAVVQPKQRISMADYMKIQEIIDNTINKRARRYNYDLSAQLAADSYHYRHGDRDELLEDEEDTARHIPKTTTDSPNVSIIGAVNPQKLEGASYIPAPIRNLKQEEQEEEETPPSRVKFQ